MGSDLSCHTGAIKYLPEGAALAMPLMLHSEEEPEDITNEPRQGLMQTRSGKKLASPSSTDLRHTQPPKHGCGQLKGGVS